MLSIVCVQSLSSTGFFLSPCFLIIAGSGAGYIGRSSVFMKDSARVTLQCIDFMDIFIGLVSGDLSYIHNTDMCVYIYI